MININPFRQTPGLCGPASLKMVLDYYGLAVSEAEIAKAAGASEKTGCSISGLVKAAKYFGFKATAMKNGSFRDMRKLLNKDIPVIVDWFLEDEGHYSVVTALDKKTVTLMDPSLDEGKRMMTRKDFYRLWFDFPGAAIKKPADLILRLMITVTPAK